MFWLTIASIIPVICALRVRETPVFSREKFRKSLLWEHFGYMLMVLKPRRLRLPALGVSFFWFSATLLALMLLQVADVVSPHAPEAKAQLGGYYLIWVGLGIAAGSALVSVVSVERIELGLIPLGGLCMAVCSLACALPFIALDGWLFNVLLFSIGVGSGIFLVPLNAYLQDMVDPATRGSQLAGSGLLDSLAMLVAIALQALCGWFLRGLGGVRLQFLLLAVLCLAAAIYVVRIIPQNFFRFVLLSLVKIVYRVKVNHAERFPAVGGALILGNHVSYVDALVLSAACGRKIRFIAHDHFHKLPLLGPFLKLFDVVPVSPTRAKDAIVTVAEALQKGDLVCLFPEGQLTRTGFMNEIRKGFELMTRKSGCPVVPVYMDDLWGSIWSFERGRFMGKWPHHYAYRVSVTVGEELPAKEATAGRVRQCFHALCAEAMQSRGELRPRVEEAVTRAMARHPWKLAWQGRHKLTRASLLAHAQILAKRWEQALSSQRVGILAEGKHTVLANLALRLAGLTPVNLALTDSDNLAERLQAHGILTLITDQSLPQLSGIQVVNVAHLVEKMDALRLGARIVATHVLPKWLLGWRVRRKRREDHSHQEAVGWLRSEADGTTSYHSLTHRELLTQSEQLRSVDSCRDGETVCTPHGFANVEGTVLGFWNALLVGASLCASMRKASLVITDRPAWDALVETGVSAETPRAIFLCGEHEQLKDMFLPEATPLMLCYTSKELERFITMSLPHPEIPTATADFQHGHRPAAVGRVLPGFRVAEEPDCLKIFSPDGQEIQLPGASIDLEDFVYLNAAAEPQSPPDPVEEQPA
jgi:1-acyl-sn-glycerol-3-phosphate acyltransferase